MKIINNSILSLVFASSSMLAMTAEAETPDGQTPAEETVCTPLKADGITKGLYGLCVAFCEAHDFADASSPITEADLENLTADAPSGRILANYNKKKQEQDPAMPCIVIEPPCPCFTADELASIDGYVESDYGSPTCSTAGTTKIVFENFSDGSVSRYGKVSNLLNAPDMASCQYYDAETGRTRPSLSVSAGTVTEEDLVTCQAMIISRCEELGLVN